MTNPITLNFTYLPAIPQAAPLREIAPRLWARDDVLAVWLGGSLARGGWDAYSDVDLFIAVQPDGMDNWREPDLSAIFGDGYIASQFSYFGENFYVHHVFLDTGDICDLHIQAIDPEADNSGFRPDDRLLLGSRDEALAEALSAPPEARELPTSLPVDSEMVQRAVESYWYNTHKHRKVLYRQLDLVLATSLSMFHFWYLRLVYIDAADSDPGDLNRRTVHSLSPIMRALRERAGHDALLAVVGMPMRTRDEIVAAVEALNDAVAEVGRRLAARYEFDYPVAMEELVWESWRTFQEERRADAADRADADG